MKHQIPFESSPLYEAAILLVSGANMEEPSVAAVQLRHEEFLLLGAYAAKLIDARSNPATKPDDVAPPPLRSSASLADPDRKQFLYLTIARGVSAASAHPIVSISDQDAIRAMVEELADSLIPYTFPLDDNDPTKLTLVGKAVPDDDAAPERVTPLRPLTDR